MSRTGVDLVPGEAIVRADDVLLSQVPNPDWWPNPPRSGWSLVRRARMTLTTSRIIFSSPPVRTRAATPLASARQFLKTGALAILLPRLRRERVMLLTDITRLWTWRPEFSAPIMLQAGADG